MNILKLLGRAALILIKFLSILVAMVAGIVAFLLIVFANYTTLFWRLVVAILISFILIWLTSEGLKKLEQ